MARTDFDNGARRAMSGKTCCARPRTRPTRPASCALRCPRNMAARTAATCGWRGDPRTHGRQGPGPAQRPAERTLDGVANYPFVLRLRHARAGGRVHPRHAGPRPLPDHVRPDRAEPRFGRHAHGNPRGARSAQWPAGSADRWRKDVDSPACMWPATARCLPAPPATTATPAVFTCFLVPANDPGVKIEEYLWTFNMPTDHPRVSFTKVWVPDLGDPRPGRPRSGHRPTLRP